MAASSAGAASPAFLAETNNPYLDQRVSIAFIVIDTAFLLLFYASRYYNRKAVGTQMLVCNTLCYVLCMGSAATGILMTQIGGVGHHVTTVSPHTFQTWLQLSKVLEFTYTPAVMFAKLAALFLYHQVFEVPLYRRIIVGIGAVVVLQGVVALILAFSICRPFRYFWTQAVDADDGTCGDVMLFYKSYSIPSLVTDVAMLVLPWPILARLNIPVMEKVGLVLTFLAASLGIITCTLRFVTFFTTPLFQDPTWYASGGPMIYALVEPSIYMIASILPTTRHLYRRLRSRARLTSTAKSDSTRNDGITDNHSGPHSVQGEHRQSRETADGWAANRHSSQEELTLGHFFAAGRQDEMPRGVVRTKIEMRDRGAPAA
ncbi:hypothetical protein DPSP01_001015 [Paraphaeosphaeria sporulosa]